jgi:primosomal protein N' (replication factor Y)
MFADIVFPLPFRYSFTYLIPDELLPLACTGVRAVAPFGKRILTGFIVAIKEKPENDLPVKSILDVLDAVPIFDNDSLKFYKWTSEYYMSSLGEALKNCVPYGTDVESKKKIVSDMQLCAELLAKEKKSGSVKAALLMALAEKEVNTIPLLQKAAKKKNIYSVLRALESQGAVTILDELELSKVRTKTAKCVRLAKDIEKIYDEISAIEARSPKQAVILLELISKKNQNVLQSDLLKKTKASASSLEGLCEKGLVEIFEIEIERKYSDNYEEEGSAIALNDEQKTAHNSIVPYIQKKEFKPFLLYGVTGSGKTQVYIELSKAALAFGRSVLVLVPEISLTPQITRRFENTFGGAVAVFHSRMSPGERYDAWRGILNGKYSVVIGARSSLFTPLKNLGLIIVDEEHDASFKQQDIVPKYHARDAAVVRAQMAGCPIVLGSATPSVESMHNARCGKYTLLELKERADNAELPEIKLVNVAIEKKMKRMENIFSRSLLDEIEKSIADKKGVIILQNRRGFSTQVYCEDCGETETCSECSVPMVFHINKNILQCHYCGSIKKAVPACTHCGSLNIKYLGTGTQRVEDELSYYFPDARIERVDSDTVSKKGELGALFNRFAKGEIDLLVGTQMVSKGLDFPNVTLVGVISAETSLWIPDFRADERTFQLLTQVSGRSGRSSSHGKVLIQTQNDKNPLLQRVLVHDYYGFFESEIIRRRQTGYPPFVRLGLIEIKSLSDSQAKNAITHFYNLLLKSKRSVIIFPPCEAVIAKLKGYYRYQILLKSSREKDLSGANLRFTIQNALAEYNKNPRFQDCRIIIDIDPQNVL